MGEPDLSGHNCPYNILSNDTIVKFESQQKKDDLHERQHKWIQEQIEHGRARRRMYSTITKIALQWSIPAVSGAIFYWIKNHVTF